jgi:undecaprenyl-diphosphatase
MRLTLIVVAVVLVAVPFAILLLEVLLKGPLTRFDQRIADEQNTANLGSVNRVHAAQWVTDLGSTAALASVVVVTVVFLAVFRRRRRQALFLVTTTVLGLITNNIVKALVGRSRPHFTNAAAHALGKSFPSGHAMNSTVVYGSLLIVAWPGLRTIARRAVAASLTAVLITFIAASRVALGVHYVSDVVAGVVLGAAFALACAASFRTWEEEGGHLPTAIESAPTLGDEPSIDRSAEST